jgi:hypothetical protein
MQQNEQGSRYEVNRNVRMVITRHNADLTRIDYSFMGNTVYLYGNLVKLDGDFSVQEIDALAREISALPSVHDIQFNLNNFIVVSSDGYWQVIRTSKSTATKGATQQEGALGDSTIVIEKAEKLTDMLDDLKADSKKEK